MKRGLNKDIVVMGIDPGTNFGWSVNSTGGDKFGSVQLPEEPTERMVEFYRQIDMLCRVYQPKIVGFEMVHGRSTAQRKIIFGQFGIVQALAHLHDYGVIEVPASMWKAEILGGNKVAKSEAILQLGAENEHQADAIGVRLFVQKKGIIG